jgi:hypothetical protein
MEWRGQKVRSDLELASVEDQSKIMGQDGTSWFRIEWVNETVAGRAISVGMMTGEKTRDRGVGYGHGKHF